MTEPTPTVNARDVHLSYGQTPALRGVSLVCWSGESVALMGPSGSGKSSLLHCLAGVLRPDSGEATVAGERLDTIVNGQRDLPVGGQLTSLLADR